ncbi:hypothetical protein [Streptomyces sp. NPDC058579]|uniref:hypothetical protein n=1 Tax=Streptomyces sp. NPDC058579 TaxID=3346548 RepID=UPI00365D19FC
MWDGIERWLRKAGGPLLLGVLAFSQVAGAQLLFSRVLFILMGVGGFAECWVRTRKLIRSRGTTTATPDRVP